MSIPLQSEEKMVLAQLRSQDRTNWKDRPGLICVHQRHPAATHPGIEKGKLTAVIALFWGMTVPHPFRTDVLIKK